MRKSWILREVDLSWDKGRPHRGGATGERSPNPFGFDKKKWQGGGTKE